MSSDQRFSIACSGCGAEVAVSRAHVGKKGRCPQCKTVFPILEPAAVTSIEAVAPADLQPISAWPVATVPPQAMPTPAANYGKPSSPFGNPGLENGSGYSSVQNDEMRLAPVASAPTTGTAAFPYQDSHHNPYQAPPSAPAQSGGGETTGSILAGIGMMVGAVVWFVAGLFFDRIFFYPPILFILGLVAFVRGMVNLFNR